MGGMQKQTEKPKKDDSDLHFPALLLPSSYYGKKSKHASTPVVSLSPRPVAMPGELSSCHL